MAPAESEINKTTVSIVIVTWNSARTLKDCLESIARQTVAPHEIIVVDNYSTDNTQRLAEELGARVLQVRGSRSRARNVAVQSSSGTHILFMDSDQILQGNVIEGCIYGSAVGEAVVVPELFVGSTYWGRCSANWKNHVVKAEGPGGGIPRFYEKSLLADQEPFQEKIDIWEDYDLYERIRSRGIRTVQCNSIIQHAEPSSFREMARKEFRYGASVWNAAIEGGDCSRPSLTHLTVRTIRSVIAGPGTWTLTAGTLLLVLLKAMARIAGLLFTPVVSIKKIKGR